MREDLIKDSKLLSLKDLGELISIVEEVKEKRIFAGYVLRSFGEEGKKYLMLRSAQDPEGFGFLEDEGEEEGEFDF